jgi:FXSXX-COOH protein
MSNIATVADHTTGLVDLSDVPLAELLASDNPVLLDTLARVLEDADRPQEIVAGFQSAI